MFLVRVVMIILCGGAFLRSVQAQKEAKNPSVVLLDEKASGAYITSLESYMSEYRARDESGRRAIFRFYNNYRFSVQVSAYNVED
jgi:Fe-S cluster assembly ATPase SufC